MLTAESKKAIEDAEAARLEIYYQSLRDKFAVSVLPVIYEKSTGHSMEEIAVLTYDMVEALIEERTKRYENK